MLLVTGGFGFLGSFLARRLRSRQIPHLLLDNLSDSYWPTSYTSPFVLADVCVEADLERVVADPRVDVVIHLAAKTGVRSSFGAAAEYHRTNVVGTSNLIRLMLKHCKRKLVLASSSSVYADHLSEPADEYAPLGPISPYGESKLQMEREVQRLSDGTDLHTSVLRFFNLAGGCANGSLGEASFPAKHLIPQLLHSGHFGMPTPIFGLNLPTFDGSALRTFTHVETAVDSILAAAFKETAPGSWDIYNICGDQSMSVLNCHREAERYFGRSIRIEECSRIEGEKVIGSGSGRKAMLDLGISSVGPPMSALLQHYAAWLGENSTESVIQC